MIDFKKSIFYSSIIYPSDLNFLNNHRKTLSQANTHCCQGIFFILVLKFIHCGIQDSRATHSKWMSECNCAT